MLGQDEEVAWMIYRHLWLQNYESHHRKFNIDSYFQAHKASFSSPLMSSDHSPIHGDVTSNVDSLRICERSITLAEIACLDKMKRLH
jgi:hypothetical protein